MFHKLIKASAVSKVGDYIDVHEDQKEDLVKRGIIEEKGLEENPSAPKRAEAKSEPAVTSTSDIINDPKEKEKKAK